MREKTFIIKPKQKQYQKPPLEVKNLFEGGGGKTTLKNNTGQRKNFIYIANSTT